MKVSVLMPAYNAQDYIAESIESILNQTFKDFELIIINDGSKDDTPKIVKKYAEKDKRIKFVNHKKNRGLIAVLNEGMDIAKGEYIARMDSDDISLPDRLKKQVKYLDKHTDVSLVGSSIEFFPIYNKWDVLAEPKLFDLLRGNCFAHPTVMLRKSDFDKYNLRYNPKYIYVEDYELWARAFRYLKLCNIQDVLLKYRWHDNNVSNKHKEAQINNVKKVQNNLLNFCTNNKKEQQALLQFLK